jgi:uncharacterized membrane protein YccC
MGIKNTHENSELVETVKMGSDRSFGPVFGIVFAVVALWPTINGRGGIRWWSLVIGIAFLVIGLGASRVLHPLLAIGNCLLKKEDQSATLKSDYKTAFTLD